jgi:mannose-1-phosphate guanylyltransferase/mannose-6-phosphate isomerase
VDRILPLVPQERLRILTGGHLAGPILGGLPELEPGNLLLEPRAAGTAPVLAWAAAEIERRDPEGVMISLHADHVIDPPEAFRARLALAAELAVRHGRLFTLGARPDRPETGYGYIRVGQPLPGDGEENGSEVASFVEKPDLATAERYLAQGHYYWNSGMFVVRASVWLAAIERFRPDIAAATRSAWAARAVDASFVRPGVAQFAAIPAESVDYAVMEPAAAAPRGDGAFEVRMVPLDAGWSDLGAWDAVWQVGAKDADGNVTVGDTLLRDSQGTLVHATSRLVGCVGLANVVVIETPDAVLVVDRSRCQDVKHIVAQLQGAGRSEHTLHRQVHRPWGWYDGIDAGERFQVKRIASLSLQKHHHRAEHWIVVRGTAEVTNGDTVTLLSENQSTYIPLGATHRLANPGKVPLEIIEVQSGSYLGEDDIVRYDDSYGRAS